jgi:hypothetical protein
MTAPRTIRRKHLRPDEVAKLQHLIATRPELTNAQIGKLIGCSDSTVGAERRGVRAPKMAARQEAFERAKAELDEPNPYLMAIDEALTANESVNVVANSVADTLVKAQTPVTASVMTRADNLVKAQLEILGGALSAVDPLSYLQGVLAGTNDEVLRDLAVFHINRLMGPKP